ncbi:proline--tRNA ligase, partial [Candidatus Pacearchaeota archaeon CG10_big_fil_rev_8_21_14_0_10_35_13]
MSKKEKSDEGLTFKKSELSEWYPQVVVKSELADYSPVKGFMIIRPRAYHIWQTIQDYFNIRLKKLNVRNAYFPLLIPEEFFKREAGHAKGFTPEVAWIANREDSDEKDRLAIRPTSETVMYDSYSRWVRSWRDLPLRINQWCNVVRWETKATRLFLRTREFLWQEGHCVYQTKDDCHKETLMYLGEYEKLCKELLALPVFKGQKPESEKFAGASNTYSIDSFMPDGKSLQCGTSHDLGQGFANSFNISFLDGSGNRSVPWQNSWGVSTRLIGALTMVHGDDKGLILPPRVAYNKLVIIPIFNDSNKKKVLSEAEKLFKELKSFDPLLDDRDGYSPGWKFSEHELNGVPLRLELGPKDIENKSVVVVKRNTGEKIHVKLKDLKKKIPELLDNIHDELYDNALKLMNSLIVKTDDYDKLKKAILDKKVVLTPICGSS